MIKAALAGVPREGTSAQAFVGAKYVSGGKTGTAQLYSLKGEKYVAGQVDERLRDHAWYVAYAPADHPRIAVAVLVENGGFGAQAAAPIARAVFDYYLLGEQAPPVTPIRRPARRGRRKRLGPHTMADVLAFLLLVLWELLCRRVDSYLMSAALAIVGIGLVTLFSASDQSVARVTSQAGSLGFALVLMWIVANIPPQQLARAAVPLYVLSVLLLCAVAVGGTVVNGSRRWLNLGIGRFQPSELMKIALPLMLAWYFQRHETRIGVRDFLVAAVLIAVPVWLIKRAARPRHGADDRRVGLLRAVPRGTVLEDHRRPRGVAGAAAAPLIWPHLHEYQQERDPDLHRSEPRSARRGLSQHAGVDRARLGRRRRQGLAERHADAPRFPARAAHRLHLRGLRRGVRADRQRGAAGALHAADRPRVGDHDERIDAVHAPDRGRDHADVLHLRLRQHGDGERICLPIVGVPLPLVSFGGTALVSLFIGLGILMSVQANRKLVKT